MLACVLWGVLAVPTTPSPLAPASESWQTPYSNYFGFTAYMDNAGVAQKAVETRYRRDDAGYADAGEVGGAVSGLTSSIVFNPNGSRWCYSGRYENVLGDFSSWSSELCFLIDSLDPDNPTDVDGGPPTCTGRVVFSFTPVVDTPSGTAGYAVVTGPTPTGPWLEYVDVLPGPPVVTAFGEGSWYAWVMTVDVAGNNGHNGAINPLRFDVTASPVLPVLPAPWWANAAPTRAYGNPLDFDAAAAQDAGYDQVVCSFCDIDAGCVWRLGFTPVDLTNGGEKWLQAGDEAYFVARVAGVQAGVVGPWSPPSVPMVLDRTPPTCSAPLAHAQPTASGATVALTWPAPVDALTAIAAEELQETSADGGTTVFMASGLMAVRTVGPGTYTWQLRATDSAGNVSAFSAPSNAIVVALDGGVTVTPDAGAPDAGAPDAGAADGGERDAGPEPAAHDAVACGCDAGGGSWLFALLALVSSSARPGRSKIPAWKPLRAAIRAPTRRGAWRR
jgi:hypothetical protein